MDILVRKSLDKVYETVTMIPELRYDSESDNFSVTIDRRRKIKTAVLAVNDLKNALETLTSRMTEYSGVRLTSVPASEDHASGIPGPQTSEDYRSCPAKRSSEWIQRIGQTGFD